MNDVVDII